MNIVHGWMAEGKTATGMAKLRPDCSKSIIKKLVARLKAAGGDTGSFTAASSGQVDDLTAELPKLPRVSVATVAKKLGTSSSTAWRVLQNR